jgi:hypothetical protein
LAKCGMVVDVYYLAADFHCLWFSLSYPACISGIDVWRVSRPLFVYTLLCVILLSYCIIYYIYLLIFVSLHF